VYCYQCLYSSCHSSWFLFLVLSRLIRLLSVIGSLFAYFTSCVNEHIHEIMEQWLHLNFFFHWISIYDSFLAVTISHWLNMHRWHITPILATITSPSLSLSLAPGQVAQQQHQFYCRIIQEHPLVLSLNAATMRSKCMNFRFHFQVYLFTSYLFSENFSLHMLFVYGSSGPHGSRSDNARWIFSNSFDSDIWQLSYFMKWV
jgi:hypothetical protein